MTLRLRSLASLFNKRMPIFCLKADAYVAAVDNSNYLDLHFYFICSQKCRGGQCLMFFFLQPNCLHLFRLRTFADADSDEKVRVSSLFATKAGKGD